MALQTREFEYLLDLDKLGEQAVFDMRGMVTASVAVIANYGMGAATVELFASQDGVLPGSSYSPAKTITAAPGILTDINVYATPYLIARVTVASATSGQKCRLKVFAASDP